MFHEVSILLYSTLLLETSIVFYFHATLLTSILLYSILLNFHSILLQFKPWCHESPAKVGTRIAPSAKRRFAELALLHDDDAERRPSCIQVQRDR